VAAIGANNSLIALSVYFEYPLYYMPIAVLKRPVFVGRQQRRSSKDNAIGLRRAPAINNLIGKISYLNTYV